MFLKNEKSQKKRENKTFFETSKKALYLLRLIYFLGGFGEKECTRTLVAIVNNPRIANPHSISPICNSAIMHCAC